MLAKLATSFNVTIDSLVFEEHDHDPDEDLRLSYEATKHLDPD